MIFPYVIMPFAKLFDLIRCHQICYWKRIVRNTAVVAHPKEISFFKMTRNIFHKPPVSDSRGKPSENILRGKDCCVMRNTYRLIGKFIFDVVVNNVVSFTHVLHNTTSKQWIDLKWREEPGEPSITG